VSEQSADGTEYATEVTRKEVGETIRWTLAGEEITGEVVEREATVSTGGMPAVGETVTFKAIGGKTEKRVSAIVGGESHPIRFEGVGAAEPHHLVEYSKTEVHKVVELEDGREIWAGESG
jgi:hypothetical protein